MRKKRRKTDCQKGTRVEEASNSLLYNEVMNKLGPVKPIREERERGLKFERGCINRGSWGESRGKWGAPLVGGSTGNASVERRSKSGILEGRKEKNSYVEGKKENKGGKRE